MGKVFTASQVANHEVPTMGAFDEIVGDLRHFVANSPVVGAVVCGSYSYGQHTIGSDLDVPILYPEEYKGRVQRGLRHLKAKADELYVPLDFAQLTPELAASWCHAIGGSFSHHIECAIASGGVIGENPFSRMVLTPQDHCSETINWIRQKIRRMDEGLVENFSAIDEARFLQKALEAPINGTRKVLLCETGFDDDSKPAVIALMEERYPDLAATLRHLVAEDRAYKEALNRNLVSYDHDDYDMALARIWGSVGTVHEYLWGLGEVLMAGRS